MSKKALLIITSVAIIIASLSACSLGGADNEVTTIGPATTETTTIQRTTEDLSTTFAEPDTNYIYPALEKDTSDEFVYELSSYSTHYDSSNTTRTTNIHNAVDKLDNIVIPSGETFSFNQVVGKRTVLAGYEAAKIVQGDEFVDGLGGGICQVSSTIFQAALRSNLQIKVRACHSLEISYVPLGGDATVQWNSQDFQFVNDTSSDIKLSVVASDGTLTCTIKANKDIPVGKVDVEISKDGEQYTLTRKVNGEVNYTTYSKYSKPKPTTTETTETTKAQ